MMMRGRPPIRRIDYRHDGRRHSHFVVEVNLAGKWRLFDPHYGRFWQKKGSTLDIATLDELQWSRGDFEEVAAATQLWNLFHLGNPHKDRFLDKGVAVVRDGHGTLILGEAWVSHPFLSLDHLPAYLGDNRADNSRRGLAFELDLVGSHTVRLEISNRACGQNEENRLFINSKSFDIDSKTIESREVGSIRLEVRSVDDVCYVTLKSVEVLRH
jgi:hypothetical protein